MGYRGGKVCPLAECGSIITAEQARLWPVAFGEVMEKIRASRSVFAGGSAEAFRWAIHRSPTTPTKAKSTVLYLDVPSIRLIAEQGRLRRISSLYSRGKKVPGNWSF